MTAVTELDSPPTAEPARPQVFLSYERADAKPLVDRYSIGAAYESVS